MRCIYCKRAMELVGRLWHCGCGSWVRNEEEPYFCASNYCDDPSCTTEHAELL